MSKNRRIQQRLILGRSSMPGAGTSLRTKHMKLIHDWAISFLNAPNGRTPGKVNAAGKLIDKPNWDHGKITYEPNPDAAVHEFAHCFLMPENTSIKDHDLEMRQQFGYCIQTFGYLQQKKSLFEVLPMAMEQKIRRLIGLPASTKFIKIKPNSPPRLCLETDEVITNRVGTKDFIRCARLLDKGCLDRLQAILNGEIKFDVNKGWTTSDSIDAKINRRARLKIAA